MLEIVNAGKNNQGREWNEVWNDSENAKEVQRQIDQLHEEKKHESLDIAKESGGGAYAMPLFIQIWECTKRAFQQYWRMPSYVFAKFGLCSIASLFIGFSFFQADSTQAGLQTIIFSVFMMTTIFSSLVQQVRLATAISQWFSTDKSRFNLCSSPKDLSTNLANVPAKHTHGLPS
jgi:ATP-binding cassette subfamily G (WHITE) protein 2 (PDR)